MQHPPLKIATGPDPAKTGPDQARDALPTNANEVAATRLIGFLRKWAAKAQHTDPIRMLDFSGARPDLALAIVDAADVAGLPIELTLITESETTGELIREAVNTPDSVRVVTGPIDEILSDPAQSDFDCVHAALSLARLREVPLLTTLGKLERVGAPCFVWTDQAATLKRKQVLDYAERIDLGFCKHKKPIRSPLFTLAGTRPRRAPIQPL